MRRYAVLFLTLVLLFSLNGCDSKRHDFREPVTFYYCNDLTSQNDFSNVFVGEIREGAGYTENRPALLSLYLEGPEGEGLVSPFPAGLKIIALEVRDDQVRIVLSDHLSKLTGLDLSLACTCLSMTIIEWYSCTSVEISAENSLLDLQESITITKDDLLLTDSMYALTDD